MRTQPTALGWIDPDISTAWDWDCAQLRRFAHRLGYRLVWPPICSRIPLVDQVRASQADVVIARTPSDFDAITLQSVMCVADVETVLPRLSLARWATTSHRVRNPRIEFERRTPHTAPTGGREPECNALHGTPWRATELDHHRDGHEQTPDRDRPIIAELHAISFPYPPNIPLPCDLEGKRAEDEARANHGDRERDARQRERGGRER
ncbi:MAG: hypothetical protein J2P18_00120 [Nocardia sp.]|nr:hypothetical protein [Nocardia sp.]